MTRAIVIAVILIAIVVLIIVPVSCGRMPAEFIQRPALNDYGSDPSRESDLLVKPLPATPSTVLTQSEVLARLEGLTVANESFCSRYDAGDYPYSQSIELAIMVRDAGVYDPYQDQWYRSPDTTDIEHIVSRKEAHVSGLCLQSDSARRMFARDSINLVLTHLRVNRSKGDRDAANWMPLKNQCWFAERVVTIRERYGLTIDESELAALRSQIKSCSAFSMQRSANPYPGLLTDSSGGCGPYEDCGALRRDYPQGVSRHHCAYRQQMDRNNDGWICATS